MKRQSVRDRVVRDSARLSFEDSLPDKARLAIVEVAIEEGVTITEMVRETVVLEAGGLLRGASEFIADESEKDMVVICCPS